MFGKRKAETKLMIDETEFEQIAADENSTTLEFTRDKLLSGMERMSARAEALEAEIATASEELRQVRVMQSGFRNCLTEIEKGMKDDSSNT